MSANKFRAVKGILPKKVEIVDWSADKIKALILFASLSLREKGGKPTFIIDSQFKETVAQYDNPFFEEFMSRMDMKGGSSSSFGAVGRLTNMIRVVLSYVKSNPHILTEEIENLLRSSVRFSWALGNFKNEKSKIGADVVVVDNMEMTDPNRMNANQNQTNLTLPEVQFNQSLLYVSSLLLSMLKGIKKSDLATMDAKDKIRLAIPMIATMSKALNVKKPQSLIFKKITINSANKDDLEKAILDYSSSQE